MSALKCTNCGASDFIVRNGIYTCRYCGAQYCLTSTVSKVQTANSNATRAVASSNSGNTYVNVNVSNSNNNCTTSAVRTGTGRGRKRRRSRKHRRWQITMILCVCLGFFGVHRFYVGKIGTGFLWMFTFGLGGFGWVADMIMIGMGRFRDQRGQRITY